MAKPASQKGGLKTYLLLSDVENIFRKSKSLRIVSLVLALVFLLVATPLVNSKLVFASYPPSILKWSSVDTPSIDGFVVCPSEINRVAFSPDGRAIYAVDIPNRQLYKSINDGVTWDNITNPLVIAGAFPPIWDIAVSPDNADLLVAITDSAGPPNGPKNVFVSTDGGQNWQKTISPPLQVPPPVDEFISCVAISPQYNTNNCYIAIATRDGTGGGRVFTLKSPGPSTWVNQTILPSLNWTPGDVVSLKFSPTYVSDTSIVILYASPVGPPDGFYLTIGTHDTSANIITWKTGPSYPVKITAPDGKSPNCSQIITADLELPFDFSGAEPGTLRRYFVSFDAFLDLPPPLPPPLPPDLYFSGIYRIDDTTVFQLLYNTSPAANPAKRISSIAYWGTYGAGKLIAGETTTKLMDGAINVARGMVDTWLCSDPFTIAPPTSWVSSNALKSPTGGGNPVLPLLTYGFANASLMWNTTGDRLYCGTSSAALSVGGTNFPPVIPPPNQRQWPQGLLTGLNSDESAFSVSFNDGDTWNQLSLIDTVITRLTDVAVIEAAEGSKDYSILYLASINSGAGNRFDSIWHSISDPLSQRWERILCTLTVNDDIILRLNPRISDDKVRSKVIVFADRNTDNIGYSADEGQYWQDKNSMRYPGYPITDFTLSSDTVIYILNDIFVLKGTLDSTTWKWDTRIQTGLTSGHTITTPLKNPKIKDTFEDWVIVGSSIVGEVAWADFSQPALKFNPPADQRVRTPAQGDVHILADEQFEVNKTIYAAVGAAANGKIYRWAIGENTAWDMLQPNNNNFFGIEQKNGALYGAYNLPIPPNTMRGVDRTLYSRLTVPPPPEWDDLTAGMPPQPGILPAVALAFTREPSSLKASLNTDNNLWAIDNAPFNWLTKQGCLWNYTDTLAKQGPWTTAPPSDGLIPADPVTGRANEINFAWRQLSYTQGYELQVAKDDNFTLGVLVDENVVPANPLAPGRVLFPGLLEASHKYFWRIRASSATTGEIIHSPWSATMYFTVMAGLPVQAKHLGPVLLQPPNNCTSCSPSPAFSWSPMFQTAQYEFVLAKDATLTQIVDTAIVPTTAYQYNGKLDKGTYYWQVKAIKPMISEASPIGCFTVASGNVSASTVLLGISDPLELAIWIGIVIYAAFAIAIFTLIMIRRYRPGE